jgi:uncharacterized protein (DUF1015 family)
MTKIIPFHGIRPTRDKAHLVASRAVDRYTRNEILDKLKTNPFTFLHIIQPDFRDGKKTRPGSAERLQKVKKSYGEFIEEGIFSP